MNDYTRVAHVVQTLIAETQTVRRLVAAYRGPAPIFFDPNTLELAMLSNYIHCPSFPCNTCDAHQHYLCTRWLQRRWRRFSSARRIALLSTKEGTVLSLTQYKAKARGYLFQCIAALLGGYGRVSDTAIIAPDGDSDEVPPIQQNNLIQIDRTDDTTSRDAIRQQALKLNSIAQQPRERVLIRRCADTPTERRQREIRKKLAASAFERPFERDGARFVF